MASTIHYEFDYEARKSGEHLTAVSSYLDLGLPYLELLNIIIWHVPNRLLCSKFYPQLVVLFCQAWDLEVRSVWRKWPQGPVSVGVHLVSSSPMPSPSSSVQVLSSYGLNPLRLS